ncbi:MAG: hypothetical protein ACRC35_02550 [Angustibacter sp.]
MDLAEDLSRSAKIQQARRIARSRPEVARKYLTAVEARSHHPYDLGLDPDGLVGWHEDGREMADLANLDLVRRSLPENERDFGAWVLGLAESFRHTVEERGGWRLLWDKEQRKHREEKITQALAGIMWVSECKTADVDVSREVDMGRGPVDFKFSQGWNKRALLEVKHISSTRFFQGAEKQLPKYLEAEEASIGVYLAVGFRDDDFRESRIGQVTETCDALSRAHGKLSISPVFVDARPKTSASKL